MSDDPSNQRPCPAEAWTRFMSAALAAAPHVPAEKLAATADGALAEYQRRVAAGQFEAAAAGRSTAAAGADATPFVPNVNGEQVTYSPTAEAPDAEDIDSPFAPPSE
jgi:hypothetical protein